jgi:S-adenosylmethionine uptake transporter
MQNYFIGILWFVLSLLSSSLNDIISKYVGVNLPSYEVTFFRFLFGTITLIPFIAYYGIDTLKTSRPMLHICRGFLLFIGIAGWTYGLSIAPVTTATVVSFVIPVFVLVLGMFFLSEKILWQRWLVTILAFVGLVITLNPSANDFNPGIWIFVLSAICFAVLDIINKIFVIQETMIGMLFYSAMMTTLFALPFAAYNWVAPTAYEVIMLAILGTSANLILFFLLKAFALVDATALAPYRYFELIISAITAYVIFDELPSQSTLLGSIILIPSALFIIYSEKNAMKNKQQEKEI